MTIQSKPEYEIKVYKIWYEDSPDDFYIGSTKNDALSKRMTCHRAASKTQNSKIYNLMREKGTNFQYCQVASCIVSNKDEQNAFEQKWIEKLQPTLNMNRAHNTSKYQKEYYKEYMKTYKKEYTQINHKKIKKQSKEYHEKNKVKINQYKKEQYIKNKNKILLRMRETRKKNSDTKRRVCCVCQVSYIDIPYMAQRHYDTKQHINYSKQVRDYITSNY